MLEQNSLGNTRLELLPRNMLQVEVVRLLIADGLVESEMDWALKYASKQSKLISDIIDAPENESLRTLARAEKYPEAARVVEERLKAILQSESLAAAA